MKILLIANTVHDVLLRRKLLSQLVKLGHSLFVASDVKTKDEEILNTLAIQAIPVHFSPRAMNPLKDVALYFAYKKIFKEISPNIVLGYHIKPNIYGAMASKCLNIPIVCNITGLGKVFDHDSILQRLVVLLYKKAFKNNKNVFVFFQNNDDKTLFLQKKIIKDDLCCDVLPGSGVDLDFFAPKNLPTSPVVLEKKLQFSYVGRLVIAKGIRLFIEAAKRISEYRDDCLFNIAGSYTENDRDFIQKDELENACKNESIQYYGQVSDVRGFLENHTDCLVFPSSYREGVPRCLLEAAAMGKPLIATDSVGTREPCKDGQNGYLVKKNDVDDLVEKMQAFIDLEVEKRKSMGIVSRQIVEANFSDEIIVKKYLEKIKDLSVLKNN